MTLKPCPRNHDPRHRYRDARGHLECAVCRELRRSGPLGALPDAIGTPCPRGHPVGFRYRNGSGEVRCRQCRRVEDRTRKPKAPGYYAERGRRLRQRALDVLGAVCVCCGQTREVFLQFDHINNDGARHRDGRLCISKDIQREVLRSPETARLRYQILCANCNWAKWAERGHSCDGSQIAGALVERERFVAGLNVLFDVHEIQDPPGVGAEKSLP